MFFKSGTKICACLLVSIGVTFLLNGASARQIPRRPVKTVKNNLTLVDKKAENLFTILDQMPENEAFDQSCEEIELKMPNFYIPGRRISEIKCLEYLWRMRFYDEWLAKAVRCGFDVDYSITVIFGGRDAEPGEFPHMGAIGWKAVNGSWIFKCGATLITEKFMLTAGHCSRATRADTKIADPVPKIVRLGETNISLKSMDHVEPQDVNIKRFIMHPYYKSPRKYYDIAIIELESPVNFTLKTHPACIWTNQYQEVLGKAALTGWGITEAGGEEAHPKLQVAEVNVVSARNCDRMLRNNYNRHWRGLVYHQMCAGHMPGGVDSCQGDSGGPLQMKIEDPYFTDWKIHYVLGVTSFGYGCGLPNTPSVYTRVASFLDWIESHVWEEEYMKINVKNH